MLNWMKKETSEGVRKMCVALLCYGCHLMGFEELIEERLRHKTVPFKDLK